MILAKLKHCLILSIELALVNIGFQVVDFKHCIRHILKGVLLTHYLNDLSVIVTSYKAAEFSFFLAVPTMAAATLYSLFLKDRNTYGIEQKGYEMILQSTPYLSAFLIGNAVAFFVALLAIKFFIGYLQKHRFCLFGWYRVIIGVL